VSNPYASLGTADFISAVQKLLPRGPAWPKDATSVETGYFGAMADVMTQLHAAAAAISEVESDPSQTSELLPDWEKAYGLPDCCAPAAPTIEQRRASLCAKIAAQGGQSPAYFVSVAAALGFAASVTEFLPFRVGQASVETTIMDLPWIFTWRLNVAEAETVVDWAVGQNGVEDPLASWGNEELACVIGRLAPAQTIVLFAFGS